MSLHAVNASRWMPDQVWHDDVEMFNLRTEQIILVAAKSVT